MTLANVTYAFLRFDCDILESRSKAKEVYKMSSDLSRVLIRLEPSNKQKLEYIADLEDRSASRQGRWIILQYIAQYEQKNGIINTEKRV